jgi:pentatricopeptide repeat protein
MEILLPRVADHPKQQDLESLWKVCELMIKEYSREDWELIDNYLLEDLLKSVGKMNDGFEKQTKLLSCKYKNPLGLRKENAAFFSTEIDIQDAEQAKSWAQNIKELGILSLEKEKLNEIVLRSFNSTSLSEFLEIAEQVKQIGFDKLAFLEQISLLYVNGIDFTKIETEMVFSDDSKRYIFSRLEMLIPPKDLVRRKLLLLCIHWYSDSVLIWNCISRILLIKNYNEAKMFVEIVQETGCHPDVDTLIHPMMHLPLVDARKLSNDAVELGHSIGKLSLMYCKYCLSKDEPQKALQFYLFNAQKGFFLYEDSLFVFQTLLLNACYEREVDAVMHLIHDASENDFEIPQDLCSNAILTLCKANLPELGQLIFDEHKTCHDTNSHNDIFAIVNSFVSMKKNTAAIQFVNTVLERHGSVGKRSRRIIMKGLLDAEDIERAKEWMLKSVQQKDIELIHMVMEYYVSINSIEEAKSLIDFAVRSGFAISGRTYSIIITAFVAEGNTNAAVKLLKKVKERNLNFGDDVYVSFLEDHIRHANWKQVETIWVQLCKRPLRDAMTVQYLKYLSLTNQFSRIDNLRQNLQVEKHPETYQSLVMVYLRADLLGKAESCLREMKSLGATSHHAYAYSHFISYYAR